MTDLPEEVKAAFKKYNDFDQEEYLLEINGRNYIEPHKGWVLDNKLKTYSAYSFPYSYLENPPSFLRLKIQKHKVVKFEKVISLRYYFYNYWHLIHDVLGQLAYIDKNYADPSLPIVVPENAINLNVFNQIIDSSPSLKNRKWIYQSKSTLIQADTIITCKNLPNTRASFIDILRLLNSPVEKSSLSEGKKILVVRGKKRSRRISNLEAIEAVIKQYGFEIIDNDDLTFKDQKELFSASKFIISVHGAGFTNLIFRYPSPLKVIEIFPSNFILPHYYWLSNQLGYSYNCVVGGEELNGEFYLNPGYLDAVINKVYLKSR